MPEASQLLPSLNAWGDFVVWLAAVTAAIGLLWRKVIRPVAEDLKALKQVANATKMTVDAQLTSNGGSSVPDQIACVRRDLGQLREEVREERQERRAEGDRIWQALRDLSAKVS